MRCPVACHDRPDTLRRTRGRLLLSVAIAGWLAPWAVPGGAQPIDHAWSMAFGDAQRDFCFSVSADPWGNLFLTGSFEGELTFGAVTLMSSEGRDVFLAKLDPAGQPLWARSFGAYQTQHGTAVAADHEGNVVLTGYFQNRIDLGGGEFVSAGGWDIFVAKFTPDGDHLWSRAFGDYADQWGTSAGVDAAGEVYLAGYFHGALDFGGGYLPTAGGWDLYLTRLAGESGDHVWSRRFGDPADQIAAGIDVNEAGEVALSGTFAGTVDFGDGPITAHTDDAFVAVYGPGGEYRWARGGGDYAAQSGLAVSIAPDGAVAFTGEFEGTIDLGGGPFTGAGLGDVFLAVYEAGGAHRWSEAYGNDQSQTPNAVAFGPGGDRIALACTCAGEIDFGGGPLAGSGEYDAALALFGAGGAHRYSQMAGDAEPQYSGSTCWDAGGALLYGGFFRGTIDLGGGSLATAGDWDIFVARYVDPVQSVDLGGADEPRGPGRPAGGAGAALPTHRLTAWPNPYRATTTLRLDAISPEAPGGGSAAGFGLTGTDPADWHRAGAGASRADNGPVWLSLVDASGRCVRDRWVEIQVGQPRAVTTAGLPAGVYYVRLAGGSARPGDALPRLRILRVP